jgi:ABC-type amino acid transport substrate-binding protein
MYFNTKKLSTFVFTTIFALAFLFGVVACNKDTSTTNLTNSSTLQKVIAANKIKVGYIVFPPTITKNTTTNQLDGHHVEAIKEIARVNKWEIEFIESDWATFTTGLNSQRFDVSIAPTFVTVPRALSVDFTRPLFYAGNSAVAKIGEKRFTSIASLDQPNVNIAVTQGEAGDEYAKANFKKAKVTSFSGSDQSAAFQAVASGRADIALGDAYATAKFTQANSQKVQDLFAKNPYNLTPVSWAVRKGDSEMLNFLNSSLDAFDYQGKLVDWERKAGANWLHLKKVWEFTNKQ